MDQNQVVSALTEKLGQTQLSSRTIATYVENNLLEEGAEYDDAYFDKHAKVLKSLQGQFSADVANQVNTFKAEWEKAHKPKVVEPTPQAQNPPQPTENEEMAKMRERMEALENALKESQSKSAQKSLRDSVKAKSEELNVANKYLWDKVVSTTTITEGMDSAKLLEVVKNTYEVELKAIIGNGAAPYGVSNTPNPQEALKGLDAYFNAKKAQGKF